MQLLFRPFGTWKILKIEVVQMEFFNKLLHLSRNTSNATIRLETDRRKLSLRVLSLTWNWVTRILRMPDDRLPKI